MPMLFVSTFWALLNRYHMGFLVYIVHTNLVCKYVVLIVLLINNNWSHRSFLQWFYRGRFFVTGEFCCTFLFYFRVNVVLLCFLHTMQYCIWCIAHDIIAHNLTSHYLRMILTFNIVWFKCTCCLGLQC